jgi:hypothetical protein
VLGLEIVVVGLADAAGREARPPRIVHQLFRKLHPLIGDLAAVRRGQQADIVHLRGLAVQRMHDGEDLGGVFLVRHQPLEGGEGAAPVTGSVPGVAVGALVGDGTLTDSCCIGHVA